MSDKNEETIKSFLWALDTKDTGKAFAHQKGTGYFLNKDEQATLEAALKGKGITMQKDEYQRDCFITEAQARNLNLELYMRTPGDEGYTFKKNGVTVIDGNAEDRHR